MSTYSFIESITKKKNITNVINKLKYISTKCFAKENTAKKLI